MSTVSNTYVNSGMESAAVYNKTEQKSEQKTAADEKLVIEKNDGEKKVKVSGRTVGNPMLTETAAKYYEELKRKYGNMDFILVSADQKEYAKANASQYGNSNKMVVLIDEEKIERMATDEKYRKQYEGVIANAASGLTQLKERLSKMGMSVKSCGMKVNDNGTASFFATMDKSMTAQNKRIAERRAEKKAEQKAKADAIEKKAQKEKQKEKLEESRKDGSVSRVSDESKDGEIVFEANSLDELLRKIENMEYSENKIESVLSDAEKRIGQQFDFTV